MSLAGKRVLYISYNGMLDPLGQSQVLPYLRELSKLGVRFTLLSFERPAAFSSEGAANREELRRQLGAQGINWHALRYHQKPSLPATVYDVRHGLRYAKRLVRRDQIEMVHARSHIAAAIALRLRKRFGLKMIFDLRGLMADEYVDANHWRRGGIRYRITKRMERRALAGADGIVTLTERVWPEIKSWDALRDRDVPHEVVPCCVDLELFRFDPQARERRRAELGIQNRLVLVYSGSIGGWYLTEQMADFFAVLLQKRADAHFLWLTLGNAEMIGNLMSRRGITATRYTVLGAAPSDVWSYLSAGDAGIAFYKPAFSRMATSPVKIAEYLACGLPLVINAGIGDSDAVITAERIGALVSNFNEGEYADAAKVVGGFVGYPGQTRRRAREIAERLFDVRRVGVERYGRLYESVLASLK
ncbi:MAG TPA: glycosyltransferase [Pyrinomonadaceae bacterium]|nr:glycosyltransferase [Pyrinomonadaceae bacterium]